MAKKRDVKAGTDPGHPEVQAYFAEADNPSVIGTAEASVQLMATLEAAGKVLEQLGRSRRLLSAARLVEADPAFIQGTEDLNQAFGSVARDCNDLLEGMNRLAQHIQKIDAGNVAGKAAAEALGYVFP